MRVCCGTLTLAALTCCSTDADRIFVPLQGESVVVLVIPEAGAPEAFASDGATPVKIDRDLPGTTRVFALHYSSCSLERLKLEPTMSLISDPDEGRQLPRPDGISASTVVDGEQAPFEAIATLPPEVASLRLDLPPLTRCAEYTPDQIVLRGTAGMEAHFGIALGGDEVLVGITDYPPTTGQLFRVTPDGATRLGSVPGLVEGAPYIGAIRVGDEIWLSTRGSAELVVGSLESGFREGPSLNSSLGKVQFAGAVVDGERDLFAVSQALAVERLVESSSVATWKTVAQIPNGESPFQRIAWVSPGEVFAMAGDPVNTLWHIEGEAAQEDVPALVSSDEGFDVLGYNADVGTVLASRFGSGAVAVTRLHLRDQSGKWTELDPIELTGELLSVIPFRDGFIFGGFESKQFQYSKTEGYCPLQAHAASNQIGQIVPIERGLAMIPRAVRPSGVAITYLTELESELRPNECTD